MDHNNRGTLRLVLEEGGPGVCTFAINNACNARCGFCNFALDKLPREDWVYVSRQGALDALDILYAQGIRYLVITGGEPTMHPDLGLIVKRGSELDMKVMLVTNGGLLRPERIRDLVTAGISSFIISIDAATVESHERNRGLPGVCEKIREANRQLKELKIHATASVTMSRLVDYEALPGFLESLGFTCVTFSYPLRQLGSSFLGYSDSQLVDFTNEELDAAFERIKRLKKRFLVLNPTPSLEEMQRFVKHQPQRFPCLGGFQYFHLDWHLMLWRWPYLGEAVCLILGLGGLQGIRGGWARGMLEFYRHSHVTPYIR